MSPFVRELISAMILIIFGDGVCAAVTLNKSKAQASGWIVIGIGWGLAVGMAALCVPGSFFNPALEIAFTAFGKGDPSMTTAIVGSIGAIIGGILGGVVVWLAYLPHWAITEDKPSKLGVFCTAPAVRNYGANFLTELIATAMLALVALSIGVDKAGSSLGYISSTCMIIALGLALGGPTGYAMNPARDLGPRIAHAILPIAGKGDSDWSYAWVPVIAPVVGAFVGTLFFMSIH